jgi:hypothetical protein
VARRRLGARRNLRDHDTFRARSNAFFSMLSNNFWFLPLGNPRGRSASPASVGNIRCEDSSVLARQSSHSNSRSSWTLFDLRGDGMEPPRLAL